MSFSGNKSVGYINLTNETLADIDGAVLSNPEVPDTLHLTGEEDQLEVGPDTGFKQTVNWEVPAANDIKANFVDTDQDYDVMGTTIDQEVDSIKTYLQSQFYRASPYFLDAALLFSDIDFNWLTGLTVEPPPTGESRTVTIPAKNGVLAVQQNPATFSALEVTGDTKLDGDLEVDGSLSIGSLSTTDLKTVTFQATGASTQAAVSVTSFTNSGGSDLKAVTCTSMTNSGVSALAGVTCTSMTNSGASTLASVSCTSMTNSGVSDLKAVTCSSMTNSGLSNTATLNVSGGSTQAAVNVSSMTNSGLTNTASLNVSGGSTQAAVSVTGMTNSGLTNTASLNVSGGSTQAQVSVTSFINSGTADLGTSATVGVLSSTSITNSGTSNLGTSTTIGALSSTSINNSGTANFGGNTTVPALTSTSINNSGTANFGGSTTVPALTSTSINNSGTASMGDDLTVSKSDSAGDVQILVKNTSNTASSKASIKAQVAGTSADDAVVQVEISGGQAYSMGVDNSDSDALVISNGLTLGTNNGARMDTSQRWTYPSQPSFFAYKSSTTTNQTGDNTYYTVICDTEEHDTGGNYDHTTGIFTAPVAGRYLFAGAVYYKDLGASTFTGVSVEFYKNGATVYASSYVYATGVHDSNNDAIFPCNTRILNLAANDTVIMRTKAFGGTKTADIGGSANRETYFCGHLIG